MSYCKKQLKKMDNKITSTINGQAQPKYQDLFDHIKSNHNVMLLQNEMQELISICQKINRCETAEKLGIIDRCPNHEEVCLSEYPQQTIIDKIKQWVAERNLHTADPRVQMCKVMEEVGELAKAINKGNQLGQIDGIGDAFVTLICVSMQLGHDPIQCLEYAYNEIKDRKGMMIGGVFVKESDYLLLDSKI